MSRYGGYGYSPESYLYRGLMQQGEGNPWYNPASPNADIGAGIRSMINQMGMFRELRRREAEEKQATEAAQAENQRRWQAEYELTKRRTEAEINARENKAEPQPLNRDAVKQFMEASGVSQDIISSTDGLPDAAVSKILSDVASKLKQRPPAPAKPVKDTAGADLAAQIKADRKLLDTAIATLGKAKAKVYSDKSKTTRPSDKQAAMDGLTAAIGRIGEYRKLIAGGNPLPQGIRDTVNAMAGDPTGLMTGDLTAITGEGSPAPQVAAPAQPSALPPEVQAYMQKHPDANLAAVLQKYQEWSRGKR